ncbi:MAG TPA: hypothetical protein VFZ63_15835 [Jiangellaceae bacterium]
MSLSLLIVVAAITIGSRVAALAMLPPLRGPVAAIAQRLPAPLFASLAALSITGSGGTVTRPILAATGCALVAALRWRSLLVILAAGMGGCLAASLIW